MLDDVIGRRHLPINRHRPRIVAAHKRVARKTDAVSNRGIPLAQYTLVQIMYIIDDIRRCGVRSRRAYGKAGNGNEMETGNGNWKRKLETEKTHQSLVQYFLHSVLSRILLSNRYETGFMSHALPLLLCYVMTAFSVIK